MGELDTELARTVAVWIQSKTFEFEEFEWVLEERVARQQKKPSGFHPLAFLSVTCLSVWV